MTVDVDASLRAAHEYRHRLLDCGMTTYLNDHQFFYRYVCACGVSGWVTGSDPKSVFSTAMEGYRDHVQRSLDEQGGV